MVETRVFCDRCSERITEDRTLLAAKSGPQRLHRPTVDLCSSCYAEFAAFLDARPAGCTAPTPRASMTNRLADHTA
jgi:hypothetical protein